MIVFVVIEFVNEETQDVRGVFSAYRLAVAKAKEFGGRVEVHLLDQPEVAPVEVCWPFFEAAMPDERMEGIVAVNLCHAQASAAWAASAPEKGAGAVNSPQEIDAQVTAAANAYRSWSVRVRDAWKKVGWEITASETQAFTDGYFAGLAALKGHSDYGYDAEFIAHAPDDISLAIAALKRVRAICEAPCSLPKNSPEYEAWTNAQAHFRAAVEGRS